MPEAPYDAIVVGAGPSGGWAAKTLTEAGMRILVLEAGPSRRASTIRDLVNRVRRKAGYRADLDTAALRRQPIQSRCYAWQYDPRAFVDDIDCPYTAPSDKPFAWIRARQEGGRMSVPRNGLQFYRFSDFDFKAASRDGFGDDWPISYAELEPFYERVERFIGLSGNRDGIPHLPDPIASGTLALTPAMERLRTVITTHWPDRTLIARRTADAPFPIGAARATGRLTLRSNAVVREVTIDPVSGKAKGVSWIEGGRERSAEARVIILAASAIESARLLLNSRNPRHPNGVGNSSGALGCFLMDHTHADIHATFHDPAVALVQDNNLGYIPQFRNVHTAAPGFKRGYGVQVWNKGGDFTFTVRGEMLPRASNRVTIDSGVKDRWGIPSPRIECTYSDNERAQYADAIAECQAMLRAAGFELCAENLALGPPGLAIHECGTARMGADPRTSVLNSHNQCWDVPNLFVVDGACFVSQGVQNPTLTMMALALRAAEHIVGAMSRREL